MTKLRLVEPGGPPRPLGHYGQALWDRITRDYDISDGAGIEFLTLACENTDRAMSLSDVIDATGDATVTEGGIVRSSPLHRDLLAYRQATAKLLGLLGINQEPTKAVGRPPGSWNYEPKTKDAAS